VDKDARSYHRRGERVRDRAREAIDLEVGKAGELYYLARGSTDIPASVGKIGYAGN
jgi:hypothetical protein